jgi:6-phosphogluconolactonase
MLRTFGFAISLALLMVACGSGSPAPTPTPSLGMYTVGGTVAGLSGSGLVLQLGDRLKLPISKSGAYTFPAHMGSGVSYIVTVQSPPSSPTQLCTVARGVGTIVASNVTNVDVSCVSAHAVGGTVSGLVGSGLTIAICVFHGNGTGHGGTWSCDNSLQMGGNGTFIWDAIYPATYIGFDRVEVTQQPTTPIQHCAVSNPLIENQTTDYSVVVSCGEYSYVANTADNTVSAYSVDANTGALTIVGTPVATGTSPGAIVATSDRRIVFVADSTSNDVSAYTVDPATGALAAAPGSPFAAGTKPEAMIAIDSLAGPSYLLVANAASDTVSLYNILASGALMPSGSLGPATGPTSPALHDPTSIAVRGEFIYVADHDGSNDIVGFSLSSPGTTIPGSPFPARGNPLSLAFGAGGLFLYSANPDPVHPSISGFSVDSSTGALTPLGGSPFPLPVSHNMITDRTGSYLYFTSGANIVGYAIDQNTGALTALPGFPVAAGANAYSLSIDSVNQFLYVANDGAANIAGFRLNASTGALTPMPASPFPAGNHPDFIATF